MQNQEDAKKDPTVIQDELAKTKKELDGTNQLYCDKHQQTLVLKAEIMRLEDVIRRKDTTIDMYSGKAKMQKNEECRELHQKIRDSYDRKY
jgi:hypothetical protein